MDGVEVGIVRVLLRGDLEDGGGDALVGVEHRPDLRRHLWRDGKATVRRQRGRRTTAKNARPPHGRPREPPPTAVRARTYWLISSTAMSLRVVKRVKASSI